MQEPSAPERPVLPIVAIWVTVVIGVVWVAASWVVQFTAAGYRYGADQPVPGEWIRWSAVVVFVGEPLFLLAVLGVGAYFAFRHARRSR